MWKRAREFECFTKILSAVFENEENLFTAVLGSEILVMGIRYAICKSVS